MTTAIVTTPAGYNVLIPEGRRPIRDRYRGQTQHQPAYLEIDATDGQAGALWESDPEIGGGVPSRVWHGAARRISCSVDLTQDDLERLSEEIAPLIDRVLAGIDYRHDGSNWIGRADTDAESALAEIERIVESTEATEWDWEVDGDPDDD